ncbi:MAG TPA: HAD family phosphatase [Beijerinckiaceae bacterium]|nr:HAD family phosphatase [Beijerinckiaceae bacterium]
MNQRPTRAVFDIGNVLLRWDPRFLYRKVFSDPERMEWFLGEVCTPAWNLEQDRGRPWRTAVDGLIAEHPDWEAEIHAFDERWAETISGAIEENVAVLERLRAAGVPTYAITNFSAEKFDASIPRFPFLGRFDGAVVSGRERLVKPDEAIYRVLIERYALDPRDCLFIDDSAANVATARRLGFHTIHVTDGLDLAAAVRAFGLPG